VSEQAGRPRHRPRGDGDGWVHCQAGHRHWGVFGAAGLLLHRPAAAGGTEVLLQHRAEWSHHGGTWGLLGGARHSDESAVQAALREAAEESGLAPDAVRVDGRYDDDHGGWAYATVLARADGDVRATALDAESVAVSWCALGQVDRLTLHPGFAETWPLLRHGLAPLHLVVDAANVVGAVPDGWWRDRAGAAGRLLRRLDALSRRGVPAGTLAAVVDPAVALSHRWPLVTVVLEGAARPAAATAPDGVRVAVAPADGDDAIVAVAVAARPDPVVVVTADRALARRCDATGAAVAGPRWLLDSLDSVESVDSVDVPDRPQRPGG
jgi:8-oxo-dGTP pyrophosphatase MutT (NUDIX family)